MIKCFWLEPTDLIRMDLRRYNGNLSCSTSGMHYHNAYVVIGDGPADAYSSSHGDSWDHSDYRWPTKCSCGYEFVETDHWQFNPEKLFKRLDTGELVTEREAPDGAMKHASWLEGFKKYNVGPDGIILYVKTPDGWWCVDGPTYNNGVEGPNGWTRTGTIPNVTANPSILMSNYHGWLRDGYLISC
jgi:hypothetical protein